MVYKKVLLKCEKFVKHLIFSFLTLDIKKDTLRFFSETSYYNYDITKNLSNNTNTNNFDDFIKERSHILYDFISKHYDIFNLSYNVIKEYYIKINRDIKNIILDYCSCREMSDEISGEMCNIEYLMEKIVYKTLPISNIISDKKLEIFISNHMNSHVFNLFLGYHEYIIKQRVCSILCLKNSRKRKLPNELAIERR
jgi:hypothetical protein